MEIDQIYKIVIKISIIYIILQHGFLRSQLNHVKLHLYPAYAYTVVHYTLLCSIFFTFPLLSTLILCECLMHLPTTLRILSSIPSRAIPWWTINEIYLDVLIRHLLCYEAFCVCVAPWCASFRRWKGRLAGVIIVIGFTTNLQPILFILEEEQGVW